MQTFLPYPSFIQSAQVLDYRRLGKQRVEALQILRTLCGLSNGWRYHPAVKMWRGYEITLLEYLRSMCTEWLNRGYQDNCWNKGSSMIQMIHTSPPPEWLGNPDFHASHRSNLLRKDPIYYSQFGWTELPNLPYVWPTMEGR